MKLGTSNGFITFIKLDGRVGPSPKPVALYLAKNAVQPPPACFLHFATEHKKKLTVNMFM